MRIYHGPTHNVAAGWNEEFALTASRTDKWGPRFSPDGSQVVFGALDGQKWNLYLVAATGGAPEMICEDCAEATDWTADRKCLLGNYTRGRVWQLELAGRRKTEWFPHSSQWLVCGHLSPDGHWLTFSSRAPARAYVVPFPSMSLDESAWISIMDGTVGPWSPDGKSVYGYSSRDGFKCIWAQRLDPATQRPTGELFAVFHSHNSRLSLNDWAQISLAIGRDKMVFDMRERTGNIWMAEWNEGR